MAGRVPLGLVLAAVLSRLRLDAVRPVHVRHTKASRFDPRFSRVATTVASVPEVTVRCWSRADWQRELRLDSAYVSQRMAPDTLAFISFPRHVNLGPQVCSALDRLVYGLDRPQNRAKVAEYASGVATLAYEVLILRYPRESNGDPAALECYAMQSIRETAELLGVEETYSPTLSRVYYRDVYPRQPAAFHSPECRRGGRLDWSPGAPLWP